MKVTSYKLYDNGDFANVEVQFVECVKPLNFTINYSANEWGMCPDDDAEALRDYASLLGLSVNEFWSHIEPELNQILEQK